MAAVSFLLAWAALAVLCLFFAVLPRRPLTDGCAASLPLAVLCGAVLLCCTAGCLGALRAGVLTVFAAAGAGAAVLVCLAVRDGKAFFARVLRAMSSPAWLLALGGSLALAVLLAVKRPLLAGWDEFSFWGTAARVVREHDTLYTLVPRTNLEARTQLPALSVLTYLFHFLQPTFTPWLLYAAYGALLFAAFGAVLGPLPRHAAGPAAFLAAACVLSLPAIECWCPHQQLAAYRSAYADLMLGALTAGAVAVRYGAFASGAPDGAFADGAPDGAPDDGAAPRSRRYGYALAASACVTAVLGLTKDVGLPLGLVVMLLCAADCFACDTLRRPKEPRSWLRLLGVILSQSAAALGAYFGWAAHMMTALRLDRGETGAASGMTTADMVIYGVRELLGVDRSERFDTVLHKMVGAFFRSRVTVFGSGAATVCCIGLLLLTAFLLEKKGNRRRPLCFALGSGIGFAGYYFFQLLCYVYVFSEGDGLALVSYPRYMSSYYLAWLLGALCVLAASVRGAKRGAGLAVMALSAALCGVCLLRVDAAQTLPGCGNADWAAQTVIEARAAEMKALARRQDGPQKVLLVSQWDDGSRWYRYACALEPLELYHVDFFNTIVETDCTDDVYPIRLDRENIADFLRENGITLLLTDVIDHYFWQEFDELFVGGMPAPDEGRTAYAVAWQPDGSVRFVPAGEVQA